ncbi:MAG: aspartyl protease family protein [Candidatus Kerfeldbacteria bacterium]|nr:aspartyl protease family protein [Candidatus Kerfeldbacteria bacterium]
MKFRYKRYSRNILRPVIPVEIGIGDRSIPYEALVDSGADFCIFPAELGELLEIDLAGGEKNLVNGITGKAEWYFMHSVTLTVGGHPFIIKAGFLPNMGEIGYGVVGQQGFFDLFIVKFDLQQEEIELKPRV